VRVVAHHPLARRNHGQPAARDRYKWVALSNTTLSMMMAMIDSSIVIIAMPAIFRGIGLDPFAAGNITYLLWMMGYLLVQAVLVVSLRRLGDMYSRVRIYNLGFVVFTAASVALSFRGSRPGTRPRCPARSPAAGEHRRRQRSSQPAGGEVRAISGRPAGTFGSIDCGHRPVSVERTCRLLMHLGHRAAWLATARGHRDERRYRRADGHADA
jgi:hypothetical protein